MTILLTHPLTTFLQLKQNIVYVYYSKQLYKLADVAYIISTYVGVGPSTLFFKNKNTQKTAHNLPNLIRCFRRSMCLQNKPNAFVSLHESKHERTHRDAPARSVLFLYLASKKIQTTEKKYDFTFLRKRKEGVSVSLNVNMCFTKENFHFRDR